MQDFEKTTRFSGSFVHSTGSTITVFDGYDIPRTIHLDSFGKDYVYFGRDVDNDIVLTSMLVSGKHGRFVCRGGKWTIEDKAAYEAKGSTNGLIYNEMAIIGRDINDGDFVRIDDGVEAVPDGVLFVFSTADSDNKWNVLSMGGNREITIGRDSTCNIILPHVSVSKLHARIVFEAGGAYLYDSGSTNGVVVNNKRVSGKIQLHEKDVISITNSKLIFTQKAIAYCCYKNGISVDATDIVIKRGRGKKSFVTCNHVSLGIKPGELVAVIGGSGAGKSTVLNCLCGYLKPFQGEVYINGVNLYNNFDALKNLIGYVPQSDIVYDNLTLHDMLRYTAQLRLPKDISEAEMENAISTAIAMVELTEKSNSFIKSFSGGQRKRASIAVELLSDPNLLYLDEPASGLDPGTERNLMHSLRKMADSGKTVILVTHSTLQLKMCDKIVFMGKGGNLCYFGSYNDALAFFGVDDIVDVYNMITDEALKWSGKFEKTRGVVGKIRKTEANYSGKKESALRQLGVLSRRYLKLVANDRQRLLLLLLQAPLLALLISFVADGNQFEQYEMSKSLLFALSCSAFWVGMLNAIQEICKERTIMKREYMTGLSCGAYVSSKILVLGVLCFIQSLMIMGVFAALVGMPDEGLMFPPFLELLTTTFITAIASTAMGLCVSSLFNNADRAMTVAPLLLMPQILFSGLIFTLEGPTEYISWLAICRFSMEGFGTTANLNDLPLKLQQTGLPLEHVSESFYDYTTSHLLASWGILLGFTVLFLVVSCVVLSKTSKK